MVRADLKASNVLVKLGDSIESWSDEQVYQRLGKPVKDDVVVVVETQETSNNSSAPRYLVEPACLDHPSLPLSKKTLLTDFGHSRHTKPLTPQPSTQETAITLPYSAPEVLFNTVKQADRPSEIWSLACTLFETRSGAQLFASFFNTHDEILRQMVQALGKFPEPWWSAWEGDVHDSLTKRGGLIASGLMGLH